MRSQLRSWGPYNALPVPDRLNDLTAASRQGTGMKGGGGSIGRKEEGGTCTQRKNEKSAPMKVKSCVFCLRYTKPFSEFKI